jgi:uncharacterized protein YqgQ
MLRYAGHSLRRQEREEKNLQMDILKARIVLSKEDKIQMGKTCTRNTYIKAMRFNLEYFGLDPNTWTEMATTECKSIYRKNLIEKGSIALTKWLDGERMKKLTVERAMARKRGADDGAQDEEMKKSREVFRRTSQLLPE